MYILLRFTDLLYVINNTQKLSYLYIILSMYLIPSAYVYSCLCTYTPDGTRKCCLRSFSHL